MGTRGGVDAAWATAVLHPFSQGERTVRRLGRRLSAALRQSQRAEEARRCGDGDARHAGRSQALRPYRCAALRRCPSGAARHEQDRQRGCLAGAREWVCAGEGFEAKGSAVRLTGWSRSRRVIVLRRRVKGALGLSQIGDAGAPQLSFAEIGAATEVYEYSVLVTSLDEDTEAFGQPYRDRGDGENIFDEMKNQWGWGGFTTHDLARCRLAARLLALFYDWWTIFVRLVDPSLHREAITSRPLFLSAIATRTRHARQTTIRVTSSHAKAKPAARALAAAAVFLRGLAKSAEQLTRPQKWRAILSRAFQAFLNGRPLRAPPRLAPI